MSIKSVLLVVHSGRSEAWRLAATARQWWERHDAEVTELGPPQGADEAAIGNFDLAVSLGGDGTMLRTVQHAFPGGVPVVGVNLGRMGYLTGVEPPAMEAAFARVAAGDFRVEDRMALELVLRPADPLEEPTTYHALNDAIVERNAHGRTIRVAVSIAGKRFLTYIADGLLVCTPTGSTAYNLSARGPVVSPLMRAMVLTPIAPHLVFDRSLVLGPDEDVTLTTLDERRALDDESTSDEGAAFVVDGVSHRRRLLPGDTVTCRAAARPARLVTFAERDFHAVLRSRFGLTDR